MKKSLSASIKTPTPAPAATIAPGATAPVVDPASAVPAVDPTPAPAVPTPAPTPTPAASGKKSFAAVKKPTPTPAPAAKAAAKPTPEPAVAKAESKERIPIEDNLGDNWLLRRFANTVAKDKNDANLRARLVACTNVNGVLKAIDKQLGEGTGQKALLKFMDMYGKTEAAK